MNYDSVILTAIALFAVLYWFIAGRKYYIGPRVKAKVEGEPPELDGAYGKPRGMETDGTPVAELAGRDEAHEKDGNARSELEGVGNGVAH